MKKIRFIFINLGFIGVCYLILYKFLFERLQSFKASLELLEFSLKNNISISRTKKYLILHELPGFGIRSFTFRPFSSDSLVVRQHFFGKELAPILSYFNSQLTPPKLMIDAGGNIGASACFMHWNFPELSSLVLEPSASNLRVAKINLEQENSILWDKALWWRSEILNFDEGRSAWARKVNKTSSGKMVQSVALSEILEMEEFSNPDYIKIDIEGAEEEVFEKDIRLGELLNSVACISVEPHSEKGRILIESKLSSWGYRVEYSGELIIGFR